MRIAVFQATELLNQEQGTEMLVALAESWVTAGCRLKGWRCSELTESSLQCPSCLQSHHLGYTWIHSCVLLRSFSSRLRLWEVVSRRELMFFPFDNRRAGTAESSEGGSRELVQLSILLTVRSLLAGASGGIKLGQQLASSEQNQAITGYFPTCNYQCRVPGVSAFHLFSLLLPNLTFIDSSIFLFVIWAFFFEGWTEQEESSSLVRDAWVLGYRRAAASGFHLSEAGQHHLCLSPSL